MTRGWLFWIFTLCVYRVKVSGDKAVVKDEGLVSKSDLPFKGNIDLEKLEACILKETPENVPFVRLEAGTNLIGGLRFVHEPATLRFFTGVLEPVSDWPEKLAEAYKADFGCEQ